MAVQRMPEAGAGSDFLLVMTTCGDAARARTLAARLVEDRLAACVNMLNGVESVYRWKDDVERGQEVLLVIKTSKNCFDAVERTIRAVSDYELPEVLAVPVIGGSGDYLNWLSASMLPAANDRE